MQIKASCIEKGAETRFCVSDPSISPQMKETEPLAWSEWNITTPASGDNPAKGERYCFNGYVKIDEEKSERLLLCGAGKEPYDEVLQFCQNDTEVKERCGGQAYAASQRCEDGVVESKCGADWYNATDANLKCESDVLKTKCGAGWFNAKTQFCQDDTDEIKNLCGAKTYKKNQFCDDRDKKIYKWVKIGEQVWMAENLKYVASGSRCGNGTTLSTADNPTCDTYGRLYDWITALALSSSCNTTSCASKITGKHRGICPEGWHIPSNAEWNTLINGDVDAGTKLKANSDSWNTNTGTDEFGFSALPGGYGNPSGSGSFVNFGNSGSWWSASEENASNAYYRYVLHNFSYVYSVGNTKTYLFSVRCVKD